MDVTYFIWGLVGVVAGGFFAVYGYSLFRMALLCIGFMIGFSLGMGVTGGQTEFIRLLFGLVAGGIVGGGLFALFRLSIYIAGGILGLVIGLFLLSLLNIGSDGLLSALAVVAGLGAGTFFGRFLGELIIVISTSVVGAYAVVYGLTMMFPGQFGIDLVERDALALIGRMPISSLTLVLLATIGLISGLAQYQILLLRRRLRR